MWHGDVVCVSGVLKRFVLQTEQIANLNHKFAIYDGAVRHRLADHM